MDLENEIRVLKAELRRYRTWVPPGHPYSPIPSKREVLKKEDKIFKMSEFFYGIDLRLQKQLDLLTHMKEVMNDAPFTPDPQNGYRYFYNNPMFGYGDALMLYGIMRHIAPRKIIEIGTGFSTALMLDVNDRFFDQDIEIFCVEAFAGSISDQLRMEKGLTIVDQDLYNVELSFYQSLEPNDILFIDSSHVAKAGGDVNYIVHNVLPLLEAGVYVQFHDILGNFDYPIEWITEGRSWNEAYLLRAFLMYNQVFEIVAFNSYLGHFCSEWMTLNVPEFMKNSGGSLWIKKAM